VHINKKKSLDCKILYIWRYLMMMMMIYFFYLLYTYFID